MFFWWWFWWNLDGVLPENSLKTTFLEDTLWLFNIAMENHHLLYRNHLFLWAIYTMAMLNNQVVILAFYHCFPLLNPCFLRKLWWGHLFSHPTPTPDVRTTRRFVPTTWVCAMVTWVQVVSIGGLRGKFFFSHQWDTQILPSGYVKIATENGRRNSEFSHWKMWFSIVFCKFTRGYISRDISIWRFPKIWVSQVTGFQTKMVMTWMIWGYPHELWFLYMFHLHQWNSFQGTSMRWRKTGWPDRPLDGRFQTVLFSHCHQLELDALGMIGAPSDS